MTRSLRRNLSLWIATATTGIGLIAAVCSFFLAFNEARNLQDDQLRQTAFLVEHFGGAVPLWTELDRQFSVSDPDARMIVAPVGRPAADKGSIKNRHLPSLPANLADGFQTVSTKSGTWRLFVRTLSSGQRIAAGQRTVVRNEVARDSSLRTLIPMLFLVPALVLLTASIIRRALDPVRSLSSQLDKRDDDYLQPLPYTDMPDEITPFITSINNMMHRIDDVMAQQRRFIADAAHELRSPLAALTLQAENLERATPQDRSQRLLQLKHGLTRTCTLLEQLLSLARQQSGAVSEAEFSFDGVVRQVLEDLMPMATAKGIDLGCERLDEVTVVSNKDALTILVRNAVDNAIRYTQPGGRVDIALYRENGNVVLQVSDNGTGIPEGEEEHMFEPFYRVIGSGETGSGLGLAIVRSISDRLGGNVALRNRENGSGALFRYTCRLG